MPRGAQLVAESVGGGGTASELAKIRYITQARPWIMRLNESCETPEVFQHIRAALEETNNNKFCFRLYQARGGPDQPRPLFLTKLVMRREPQLCLSSFCFRATGLMLRWHGMMMRSAAEGLCGWQVKARPPTFAAFTRTEDLSDRVRKQLVNRVRQEFHFAGVPIRVLIRPGREHNKKKPKKSQAPQRRAAAAA